MDPSKQAPTSRTRERPAGDEEASANLKLGEFEGVISLSLSEARLLINTVLDQRRAHNPSAARKIEETETLIKTQDYLDVFARFKQKQNIEAVEALLDNRAPGLERFEKSQLATLCCTIAEEAKTLIPSITHKINDDDLNDLLREISNLRTKDEMDTLLEMMIEDIECSCDANVEADTTDELEVDESEVNGSEVDGSEVDD